MFSAYEHARLWAERLGKPRDDDDSHAFGCFVDDMDRRGEIGDRDYASLWREYADEVEQAVTVRRREAGGNWIVETRLETVRGS